MDKSRTEMNYKTWKNKAKDLFLMGWGICQQLKMNKEKHQKHCSSYKSACKNLHN